MPYLKSEALWNRELQVAPGRREAGIDQLMEVYEASLAELLPPADNSSNRFRFSDDERRELRDQVRQRFDELP